MERKLRRVHHVLQTQSDDEPPQNTPPRRTYGDADDRGRGGGATCVHTAQTLVLHNCHTDGAKTHRDENLFGKKKETIHSRENS